VRYADAIANGIEVERRPDAATTSVAITAAGLCKTVKGGRQVLHDVSLAVRPGELVAIVGGSGAGKTMLLEALAGVRSAERGEVRFDGVDLYANLDAFRSLLGYVPQDDIIHAELPLERTLRYAARLRLPASVSKAEIDAAVEGALTALDLAERPPRARGCALRRTAQAR
jgi:ABC-type multidrug transport system ATPase subunit